MKRPSEFGMTLIELTVSMLLMGILMLALVGAMSTFLTDSPAVSRSLDASNQAQSLSTYWPRDIRGAASLSVTGSCVALPVTVNTVDNGGSTVPVDYVLSGVSISRTTAGQTVTVARSVATACVTWAGSGSASLTITTLDGQTTTFTAAGRLS